MMLEEKGKQPSNVEKVFTDTKKKTTELDILSQAPTIILKLFEWFLLVSIILFSALKEQPLYVWGYSLVFGLVQLKKVANSYKKRTALREKDKNE